MTIKQMADKYQIPYNLAYEGTLGVTPRESALYNREYPEEEVIYNVKEILRHRIIKRKKYIEDVSRMLSNIELLESK